MSDIYIKIKEGRVVRTIDLGDGVLIDKSEDEDIVGVEILNVEEVKIGGKIIT